MLLFALPVLALAQNDDANENEDSGPSEPKAAFESYSRYDFIPGNDLVYTEDFAQDVIGEFPLLWTTSNRGEVVTIKGQEGKWLRMFHKSHFAGPLLKSLPDNFTAEFDMIIHFKEQGYVYPNIGLRLVETSKEDKDGNQYIQDPHRDSKVEITLVPGDEESSTIFMASQKEALEFFSNDNKGFRKLGSYYGKPMHVAIWVQKQRLRLWINGEKIYDIPKALPPSVAFNRLAFEVGDCYYEEEKVGVYVSNIRIAQGAADIRSKLLTDGKFVTSSILFDVNSDKIKGESTGLLKEIAAVLSENPSLKLMITGFTDSDGDDAKNLELSRKRSQSVRQFLTTQFGIDESRLSTDGKGEANPIAPNNTKEGKARNRRVEFIKQ